MVTSVGGPCHWQNHAYMHCTMFWQPKTPGATKPVNHLLLTMAAERCHFFHCFLPRTCWHPPLKPATCSHIAVVPPMFLLYNQVLPGFAPEASWNLMQATSEPLPEKGSMKTIKLQALGVCDVQLSAWPSGDLNLPSAFVPHSCPSWPQQILRVGSSSAIRFLEETRPHMVKWPLVTYFAKINGKHAQIQIYSDSCRIHNNLDGGSCFCTVSWQCSPNLIYMVLLNPIPN